VHNKDIVRNSNFHLGRDRRQTGDEGNHPHDTEESEAVSVKGKLDVLRVEDVSDQTSLGCQKPCVLHDGEDRLITSWPYLDYSSATEESVLLRSLF